LDAVVVGAGPAGWAAAAASRAQGARVTLVAPEPKAPFTPTYCVWRDEVSDAWRPTLSESWPAVQVAFTGRRLRRVERAYAKFDNARLQRALHQAADGTEVWSGVVESVQTEGDHAIVHLNDGRTRKTDYVIDCSGANSALVRRPRGDPPAVQTAFGRVIRRADDAGSLAELPTLMDYRPVEAEAPDEPASFGYVLPFSDGTTLVEETVLAARPAFSVERLEQRLRERLDRYGWTDVEVVDVERVFIPMGAPLPEPDQVVVAFGAAASMVHPATGYLVGTVLRRAPDLGRAMARAGAVKDPLRRAERVNRVVWSNARRRGRALHEFGLDVLLHLSSDEVRAFFEAFFETPRWAWTAYLRGDAPMRLVAASMAASFVRMDADCRRRIDDRMRARGLADVWRSVWSA